MSTQTLPHFSVLASFRGIARRLLPVAFLAVAGSVMPAFQAAAQTSATDLPQGIADARLRAGWQTATGTHMTAIHIVLQPGWKTYWRQPGDAGIPPDFDFTGSQNLKSFDIHWPKPEVFGQNGMTSIGYSHEMLLPVELTASDPDAPINLSIQMDLGLCHEICVPASLGLQGVFSGQGVRDAQIQAALDEVPAHVASTARCTVTPIADGMQVRAHIPLPDTPRQIVLFELPGQPVWVSDAQMQREGTMLVATADFVPPASAPFTLDTDDLRMTVMDATNAVQMDGCAIAP
ncbi:hypothetical protein ERN12_10390 [Rhodobacteraceae bacterium]|nr:hypothetical protein ERN12_10390 [Paracoccaceae bacterium]